MHKRFSLFVAAGLAALAALTGGTALAQDQGASIAFAELTDLDGAPVGRVDWQQEEGYVTVDVEVHDLPPGFHGFHVHEVGLCEPPFTSAGGHFDPSGAAHPDHAGDMPVILVHADGTGSARFTTDRYTVNDLFGTGVIIHELPDNYADIPDRYVSPEASPAAGTEPMLVPGPDAITLANGDGGGRIACGPIAIPKPATN